MQYRREPRGATGPTATRASELSTTSFTLLQIPHAHIGDHAAAHSTTPPVGDMAPETPATKRGTLSPSGGGGVLQTPRYKARVILGAPSPAGTSQTPRYKIELGAGAQQHGQR